MITINPPLKPISSRELLAVAGASLFLCALPFIHQLLNFGLMFPENQAIDSAVVLLVLICGAAGISAGVVVSPVAIWCVKRRKHRQFITVALMTIVTAIGYSAAKRWYTPPTAARFFESRFHAPLPPSAHDIRAHHASFDGQTEFSFSCSAGDCAILIEEMKLKALPQRSASAEDDLYGLLYPLRGAPDFTQWKKWRVYERHDGRTGAADFLICDESSTLIFVRRFAGFSKSDDELNDDKR